MTSSILDDLVEALEEARDLIAAGRRYAAYGAIDAALTKARQAPEREGSIAERAREILNRHCEYIDGLERGQRVIGTANALAAVREALTRLPVRHVPITGTVGEPSDGELEMNDDQIKRMVGRFLGWRLPDDFAPDAGIDFTPMFNEHADHPMRHEPTGTNLFTATQAEAMVRYMLADDGEPSDGVVS
jgi:hypothetical protein